jgi:hypothetical protein
MGRGRGRGGRRPWFPYHDRNKSFDFTKTSEVRWNFSDFPPVIIPVLVYAGVFIYQGYDMENA